ncbi:hypothetical protein PIB30_040192 [Stylosanthes scabra]|uniref:F-box domain-containing protein n=1 Tax=Stylosanthes scabra TaxID=79078 RepID=A0ABU6ZD87_9FABA|nr:hypothetical protein [Stylosanthes scabra]
MEQIMALTRQWDIGKQKMSAHGMGLMKEKVRRKWNCWVCHEFDVEEQEFIIGGYVTQIDGRTKCWIGDRVKENLEGEAYMEAIDRAVQWAMEDLNALEEEINIVAYRKDVVGWLTGKQECNWDLRFLRNKLMNWRNNFKRVGVFRDPIFLMAMPKGILDSSGRPFGNKLSEESQDEKTLHLTQNLKVSKRRRSKLIGATTFTVSPVSNCAPLMVETTTTMSFDQHHLLLGHPPPATIPLDVVAIILLKLPVKCLLRFKCTCKCWNELSSDPQFAKDHLQASASDPNRNRFLVMYKVILENNEPQSSLRDYPLSSVFEGSIATTANSPRNLFPCSENVTNFLCGSCDGMFCMTSTTPNCPIVCNPSTGKFKQLPRVGPGITFTYGFGYYRVSYTYKVVAILNGRILGADHFVYTLGTDDDDSWRRIHGLPSCFFKDNSGKFVDGTLNWLAFDGDDKRFIVSLDLGTEQNQTLMLPPVGRIHAGVQFLCSTVLKGSLCIVADCQVDADYWVMKEHGNADSWTLLFRISYCVTGFPLFLKIYMAPICVSDDGDQLLVEYWGKLNVYNSRIGYFKAPEIEVFKGSVLAAGVYTETLMSPTSK